MVAGLLPTAHLPVHLRVLQPIGKRWTEQQMIDAQPSVPPIGVPEIVPKGVDRPVRVESPERVGPALADKPCVERPDFRGEQGVFGPAFRVLDVDFRRHDVEVAGDHHRQVALQQALRMRDKLLEPSELVVELGTGPRVTVRQVQPTDDDAVHRCLNVAALRRVGIVRQSAPRLVNLSDPAENGDAVPALLAVPDRLVA